jgi:hypothetical protein
LMVWFYDDEAWGRWSKLVNSNPYYGKGQLILNGQTVIYYLPLLGLYLSAAGFPNFVIDGDVNVYVNFNSSANTVMVGSTPTLVGLSLDVRMEQLPARVRGNSIKLHQSQPHHYVIPYTKRQTFVQTMTAGQQYTFNLTGLKGDVVWLDFCIRLQSNLYGDLSKTMIPIQDFSILNSNGVKISGDQLIDGVQDKFWYSSEYFPGSYTRTHSLYSFVFPCNDTAPHALIYTGQKLGFYPFTTYEVLQIDTLASAGVAEVQTITATANPTGGAFFLSWNDDNMVCYTSGALLWNIGAAAIQNALMALPNFHGTVVAGGDFTAGSTITLTFGGDYANRSLGANGLVVEGYAWGLVATASPLQIANTITTAGVEGITGTPTVQVDVTAWCTNLMRVGMRGDLEIQSS